MTVQRRIKTTVSDDVKPPYYCGFLEPHVIHDLMPSPLVVSVVVWEAADKKTYLTEITFGSEADYQTFEKNELPKVMAKIAEVFRDSPVKPHYQPAVLKPGSSQADIEKYNNLLQGMGPCTVILKTGSFATTEQLGSSGLSPSHDAVPSQSVPPSVAAPASSGFYSLGLDIGSSTTTEQLGSRGLFRPYDAAPSQSVPPRVDGPEGSGPHTIVPPSA